MMLSTSFISSLALIAVALSASGVAVNTTASYITTSAVSGNTTTAIYPNTTTSTNPNTTTSTNPNTTSSTNPNTTTTTPPNTTTTTYPNTTTSTNPNTTTSTNPSTTTTTYSNTTTTTYSNTTTTTATINTTTSSVPTTTSSKPVVGTPTYLVRDKKNNVCLMLEADITTVFHYLPIQEYFQSTIPKSVKPTGLCSEESDQIYFKWSEGSISMELHMKYNKSGGSFSLTDASFKYSATVGQVYKESWSTAVSKEVKTELGTSYNCTRGVNITVGGATFAMKNLRVGAFMDDASPNPSFPKTGTDCLHPGLSPGAIAGIVIGAVAAAAIIVIVGVIIYRRRSRANAYTSIE